ncbi:MAG: MFS transporter [Ilumatobacteraceae bacterium]
MRSAHPLPPAYWRQWSASAVSNLGDGVNFVAIPLLAFAITSDERLLSATAFAVFAPWIALALPIGRVVDRYDRRRLMVGANLVRVALFSAIAVAAWADRLPIGALIVVLFVIGACEVLFDSSAQAFLPMIVDHDALPRANGLLYAAEVVAGSLAGLALGALLFGASVGLPFVVNAVSFAIAAALIASVRTRPGADPPPTGGFDATSGLRSLREVPVLRVLAAMFALTNLGLLFGQGIFVKFASVELGLGPYGYGALLVVTALGAATGGLLGPALVDRFGTGVAVLAPFVVFGPAQFAIAWSGRVWAVGAAGFVLGGAIATWNVATVTLRQQVIPSERFGRVNSTYRWIGATASAIGIGSGGFVARATDLRAPFVVGGVLTAVTGVLFARPLLRSLAAS